MEEYPIKGEEEAWKESIILENQLIDEAIHPTDTQTSNASAMDIDMEDLTRIIKEEPLEKPMPEEMLNKTTVRLKQKRPVIVIPLISNAVKSSSTTKPTVHCRICKRAYRTEATYRRHVKNTHESPAIKTQEEVEHTFDAYPDVEDPNNYCKICKRTFRSKNFYRWHLRSKHKMEAIRDPPIEPKKPKAPRSTTVIETPNREEITYNCAICARSMVNKRRFLSHIRRVHNIVEGHSQLEAPDTNAVQVEEGENTCSVCQVSFTEPIAYQEHVQTHHASETVPESRNFMFDTKSYLMNCRFCSETGLSEEEYRTHLQAIHTDRLKPLVSKIVDPYSHTKKPEVYCTTCDEAMSTLGDCLTHLRRTHKLQVVPDPTLIINKAIEQYQKTNLPIDSNNSLATQTEEFANIVHYLMKSL